MHWMFFYRPWRRCSAVTCVFKWWSCERIPSALCWAWRGKYLWIYEQETICNGINVICWCARRSLKGTIVDCLSVFVFNDGPTLHELMLLDRLWSLDFSTLHHVLVRFILVVDTIEIDRSLLRNTTMWNSCMYGWFGLVVVLYTVSLQLYVPSRFICSSCYLSSLLVVRGIRETVDLNITDSNM